MSEVEIDVRVNQDSDPVYIRFADVGDFGDSYTATRLNQFDNERITIEEDDLKRGDAVAINSAEHAQNLIKALNKAIELGWLK